ncbi:hypothetical protein [Clostridium sp. chh4-2]|uniref:hypothetical protein n=1 Tax=Clostridium sp. chh4-2 TaxID=2067550 RepID=UPI0015E19D0F|nr:hypothetical protein [Clostridium sp. chh4-2]
MTFKVKSEVVSENPFTIYLNLAFVNTNAITLFLTRLAKTSTESGGGAGRRRAEGLSGPGRKDAAKWDRMEPL